MKLAFFDTHGFDRKAFDQANSMWQHEITYFEPRLRHATAQLAKGFDAVCAFVNDRIDRDTIQLLKQEGIRILALRSAGFNQVDMKAAHEFDLPVVRVPEYSPYAVAEHAVALILTMNRRIHRASNRVRELNFSLDGLVGFDLHGKTVGVIGTGRIGQVFARIMQGFGCQLLAYDAWPKPELSQQLNLRYVPLQELLAQSDIISLHVPLSPETHHMIDEAAFQSMKPSVVLVNTSRGGLVKTSALLQALKSGQIGFAALDVYEEEEGIFFHDMSESGVQDDVLARLTTFPNVLITAHQAFLTHEALANIANTTLSSLRAFEHNEPLVHQVQLRS
ncbi:2-hydroxyacid dehydrogenase [Oligoflexus tunisiensis]|uniref:2-hydroxyacid dehydrogenase n=1 Tax=Oligoflexus tunisiensis TaxID=708132 RepID=UPI000A81B6D7|nr:2-hydroxyacid dehydrogenase [Oligoflexus tunisiensis]